MDPIVQWLSANYQWLFSGAGVTSIAIVAGWSIRRRSHRRRIDEEPIDCLSVHIQPSDVSAHNDYEHYDAALGIYISNSGEHNLKITRAWFDPVTVQWGVRRRTKLPIHLSAFRDRRTDQYELKFGSAWREFGVTIQLGERVFTYLPLSRPVTAAELDRQQNGEIVLEYETPNGPRLHTVRV